MQVGKAMNLQNAFFLCSNKIAKKLCLDKVDGVYCKKMKNLQK